MTLQFPPDGSTTKFELSTVSIVPPHQLHNDALPIHAYSRV